MSCLRKRIDFRSLENELESALKADELYKLQNDAKIRAIEQRVPTYDNFRDMVLAAHLRPLERNELNKKSEVSWNHCFNNKSEESILQAYERSNLRKFEGKKSNDKFSIDQINPKTTLEFVKIWSCLVSSESKFQYLYHFRDKLKDKYFKAEAPSEFLGEFFKASLDVCSIDTDLHIIEILTIFSRCNRISLSMAMMSSKEKDSVKLLFQKLLSLVQSKEELDKVENLKKIFCA
ncbi:hypothetical protein QAD02_000147 [Eretmocerus hayati]|uniref:Uncharacterized protein n=1 Tax=Eretmocerus hayati TaxID=131215 RepID=A0ACC2NCR1_9HYME|nr:hypothetical protein QAD02_000147 [Eretmocerus hayati]